MTTSLRSRVAGDAMTWGAGAEFPMRLRSGRALDSSRKTIMRPMMTLVGRLDQAEPSF